MEIKQNYQKFKNWTKENIKDHLINSTGMLVASNPLYMGIESGVSGLSKEICLNSRVLAAATVYCGIGQLYKKGRDGWRKTFNVTADSKEFVQDLHDRGYGLAFNAAFAPSFYFVAGSRNIKEIALASVVAGITGLFTGPVNGYGIDMARDLVGKEECKRKFYPDLIKKQNLKIKKAVAAGAIVGSLALCGAIYSLIPEDRSEENLNVQGIEQVVKNNLDKAAEGGL
jgi:hypothetical protein